MGHLQTVRSSSTMRMTTIFNAIMIVRCVMKMLHLVLKYFTDTPFVWLWGIRVWVYLCLLVQILGISVLFWNFKMNYYTTNHSSIELEKKVKSRILKKNWLVIDSVKKFLENALYYLRASRQRYDNVAFKYSLFSYCNRAKPNKSGRIKRQTYYHFKKKNFRYCQRTVKLLKKKKLTFRLH